MLSYAVVFCFAFLWVIPLAESKVIESISPPNVRVFPIFDARLDFAMRIESINRAVYSIDMMTYMHNGEIGAELNRALQAAIQRGVKVRFVTEMYTTMSLSEPRGSRLPRELARTFATNANCLGEILCVSPIAKMRAGLHPLDGFHEKILILDAGKPTALAWLGGRNNDEFAKKDLDFAAVVRPLDPKRPSAIDSVLEIFEDAWREANKIQLAKVTPVQTDLEEVARRIVEMPDPEKLLEASKLSTPNDFRRLKRAVFEMDSDLNHSEVVSFIPKSMAISSNDFMAQVTSKETPYKMSKRDHFKSSNVDMLAEAITGSKEIFVTSMAIDMPEALLTSLRTAILNGAHVSFFTNSPELEKARIPGAVQFDQSMNELKQLYDLTQKPGSKGKLSVFLLDPKKIDESTEYRGWLAYLHRKMVVTDRHVFLGSDNYTDASRLKNNEVLARFEDPKFVSFMRSAMNKEMKLFYSLPCAELLEHAKRSHEWGRSILAKFFRQFL